MISNRRGFLKTIAASAAIRGLSAAPEDLWGGPVLDLPFHMRRTPEQTLPTSMDAVFPTQIC